MTRIPARVVDVEPGMKDARSSAGDHARQEPCHCGAEGAETSHEQSGGDRGPKCDRAFGSNIGEGKHSEAEEDTKSQQRQDEADCHRTD